MNADTTTRADLRKLLAKRSCEELRKVLNSRDSDSPSIRTVTASLLAVFDILNGLQEQIDELRAERREREAAPAAEENWS